MLMAFSLGTILLACIVVRLITYARQNYGKLEGKGFPVVPPTFMLGSLPNIHKTVQQLDDIDRFKVYGPTWGLYQGQTPIVFITDPELIRKIFEKDSAYFFDRDVSEFGHPIINEVLDNIPGEKWKRMRVSQTRLFSSGKIKHYSSHIMSRSILTVVQKLKTKVGTKRQLKIDTREQLCLYSADVTAKSMFSIKVDMSESSKFYRACRRLIGDGQKTTSFFRWTLMFPWLARFEPTLILDDEIPKVIQDVVKARQARDDKLDDYITVFCDLLEQLETPKFKELGVTETTLLGQAVNLFLAGFDRISTTMTFLLYHLAKDPTAQERLYEEIRFITDEKYGKRVKHESLSEMPFLHACVTEASRLYPTLIRPERVCNKDWEDAERGIKIVKGVTVMIPSWAANRNPEVYENPDEFLPERFLPENKGKLNPFAFTSFGFGHRNCIGMRFAYEAMKMGICHLVRNFKFEICEDTKANFKPGMIMIVRYDPVYLNVVKRG